MDVLDGKNQGPTDYPRKNRYPIKAVEFFLFFSYLFQVKSKCRYHNHYTALKIKSIPPIHWSVPLPLMDKGSPLRTRDNLGFSNVDSWHIAREVRRLQPA